jgi:hypothetical protein
MSNIFNDFETLDFINLDEMQWGGDESQNLVLTASAGAYSAAGAAVSFIRGRRLSASAGAVVSTGQPVALQAAHRVAADAGAIGVTGTEADLAWRRPANAGTFLVVGSPATLTRSALLDCGKGEHALEGKVAHLEKTWLLPAAAGSLAATGTEAELQSTRVVLSDGGSYDVQGLAATLRATRILRAESGSVAALGKSADLLAAHGLIAESGGCNLTGFSAGKLKTYRLAANNGVLEVAGKRAYLSSGKALWLSGGSMSIEGYAAELTVFHNKTMPASVAEFLVAGFGVEFRRTYVLTSEGGSFQIQGVATGKGYHEIPSLHPANVVHEEDQALRLTRITSAGRAVAESSNAPHVRRIIQTGQVVARL